MGSTLLKYSKTPLAMSLKWYWVKASIISWESNKQRGNFLSSQGQFGQFG
jgi:hypothetical protein